MTPFYDVDGVTIYHADCRDVMPELTADVLITDPPYVGREDLFDTSAVDEVLAVELNGRPGLVFWPCATPAPSVGRSPDAEHIWHKSVPIHPNSTIGNVAGHHYERVLAYGLGKKCEVFRVAAVMPNFAACRREFTEHPTQKPLALMSRLIQRTEGVVLDPFMGSGSTLHAARDLGRRAIGVEVDERYCEIAAERLSQQVLDLEGAS